MTTVASADGTSPGLQVPTQGPASGTLRVGGRMTALSWIPVEAITGMTRWPFDLRITHYDPPPPDRVEDFEHLLRLSRAGRFRFANQLSGWVDVQDGQVVGHGQQGEGILSETNVELGRASVGVAPVAYPEIRPEPLVTPTSVTFFQTAGGRTGLPARGCCRSGSSCASRRRPRGPPSR